MGPLETKHIILVTLGILILAIWVKELTKDPESVMLFGNPTSVVIGWVTESWMFGLLALSLNIAVYQYRMYKRKNT